MLSTRDRERLPVWQIQAENWQAMRFSPPAPQFGGQDALPVGLPGIGTAYWHLPERFNPLLLCTALQATTIPMDLNEAVIDASYRRGVYDMCPVPFGPPASKFRLCREPKVWTANRGMDQGEHLFTTYEVRATDQHHYQDDSPIAEEEITLWHGTRSTCIASILERGFFPSELSHGVTGLWTSVDFWPALQIGSSMFDQHYGVVVELAAPVSAIINNRTIRAGKQWRRVVRDSTTQTLPVRLVSVTYRIRGPLMIEWFKSFEQCLHDCAVWFTQNSQVSYELRILDHMLTKHVLHRLAYLGSENVLTEAFGAGSRVVDRGVSQFSILIAKLAQVLFCENLAKKMYYSRQLQLHHCPPPLVAWLRRWYPGWVTHLEYWQSDAAPHYDFGEVIGADAWNHAMPVRINIPDPHY